jgi:cell division protein FtsI (penicillin-binding protein 3)
VAAPDRCCPGRRASPPFGRPRTIADNRFDIELTIDEQLQFILERELAAGVAENQQRADRRSSWIRAPARFSPWRAGRPSIRTSTASRRDPPPQSRGARSLRAGSTFKIVTASAALEEHIILSDRHDDVSGGSIRFDSRVIYDTHDYGILSFTDVLVKSSNVGRIKVDLKIGPERLVRLIQSLGFGRRTSADFPGENPGIVGIPPSSTASALASVSMGYQVGVTPLQMAAAVSSVANGGTLYEPRVLRAVVRDGVRTLVPSKVVRQTIKPETAETLTTIMEESSSAAPRRWRSSGLPSRGQDMHSGEVVGGRYSTNGLQRRHFVGFVPPSPVLHVIVVIDSPQRRAMSA